MPNPKPPLELDVEIETHDGALYRWDPTSRLASKRPQGLSFSTQRGEGFGPGAALLTRDVMRDYPDLSLLDTIRYIGKNGEIAYEGRVHDFARTNDPQQQFAISSIGWYGTAAAPFRRFSEVFSDWNLGNWGEPTLARRLQLVSSAIVLSASTSNGGAAVSAGEAPGIVHDFAGVSAAGGGNEAGEAHYYPNGVDIGAVYFDHRALNSSTDFENNVAVGTTDTYGAFSVSATFNGTANASFASVTAPGPGYKWARSRAMYTGAYVGPMTNAYAFQNVVVIGRHGLPLQGSWPNVGFFASDILAYIFNNFTPLTWAGEATTYPIRQAAFQAQYPREAAALINDYHLWEIGCFEDKKVFYYPADLTTYDWQVRTDDPGVRFNPLQGDSIDGFANGVEVTYTDFTGRVRTLYPNEYAELRDDTESNPANLHGDQLWKDFTVPYPTTQADALQMGRAYLAEYNRPKSPGTITITGGYIKDGAGHWQQGWKPRCGETISLTNHPNDAPRLITATPSWDQDSKALTISVDNGYALLEAFIARMANAREAANRN